MSKDLLNKGWVVGGCLLDVTVVTGTQETWAFFSASNLMVRCVRFECSGRGVCGGISAGVVCARDVTCRGS